jgi:hypothetical protein
MSPLFNKPASEQSVTKVTTIIIAGLVTPKAAAKQELMFNKPASTN